ncbi:MAG: BlaI/MecI/CopY family transcriptional regulator [Bacteroidota bacterium]
MQLLTKAEEEIMQVLWKLKNAFIKDVLEEFKDTKPAYNTVSTIVRILEKKGFVSHKSYGKTHQYHPVIGRDEYRKFYLNNFLSKHFGGSFSSLVSFFAKEHDMNLKEVDELMKHIKEDLNSEKDDK